MSNHYIIQEMNLDSKRNQNYTSKWYLSKEKMDLIKILKPGDILQVKDKSFYEHWILYMGEEGMDYFNCQCKHPIVHRIKPPFFSSTTSIQITSLDEIWTEEKLVRIHNFKDEIWTCSSFSTMVTRVEEQMHANRPYNVLHNNCEQFVHIARYGKPYSGQTVKHHKGWKKWTLGMYSPVKAPYNLFD